MARLCEEVAGIEDGRSRIEDGERRARAADPKHSRQTVPRSLAFSSFRNPAWGSKLRVGAIQRHFRKWLKGRKGTMQFGSMSAFPGGRTSV
jgi:hypothetical protein